MTGLELIQKRSENLQNLLRFKPKNQENNIIIEGIQIIFVTISEISDVAFALVCADDGPHDAPSAHTKGKATSIFS